MINLKNILVELEFKTPEDLVTSYSNLESKLGTSQEEIKANLLQELETEALSSRPATVGDYQIPETIDEIKKLPGIGEYTGNALLGLVNDKPSVALDGNVKRIFSRNLNKEENKINFNKFIEANKKKLFNTNRNADFVEALMEFGALICKPKDPNCLTCCLNKTCKYFKSDNKIKSVRNKMIRNKNYNIFCHINKKKQIALTKNNQISFLKDFNLPKIKEASSFTKDKNWKFLKNYKNSISNLKLNINLYYKFSNKLPPKYNWYSLKNNKEFVPSFTKKILRQVSTLF